MVFNIKNQTWFHSGFVKLPILVKIPYDDDIYVIENSQIW